MFVSSLLHLCSFFLCISRLSNCQYHVNSKYTFSPIYISANDKHKLLTAICVFHLQFGLPACTWPFCLSALTFLLLTTGTNKIFKLPLAKVTYPEKNLGFFWKLKKQEKKEKAEKDIKEREERQKAIIEEVMLNEKEKLRLELERMENGTEASEASESKNDKSLVMDHALAVEQQGNEEEQIKLSDPTKVTAADYV